MAAPHRRLSRPPARSLPVVAEGQRSRRRPNPPPPVGLQVAGEGQPVQPTAAATVSACKAAIRLVARRLSCAFLKRNKHAHTRTHSQYAHAHTHTRIYVHRQPPPPHAHACPRPPSCLRWSGDRARRNPTLCVGTSVQEHALLSGKAPSRAPLCVPARVPAAVHLVRRPQRRRRSSQRRDAPLGAKPSSGLS